MANPHVRDMAADLSVRYADGHTCVLSGRLLVLSDGLGIALDTIAINVGEGTTGVRHFG